MTCGVASVGIGSCSSVSSVTAVPNCMAVSRFMAVSSVTVVTSPGATPRTAYVVVVEPATVESAQSAAAVAPVTASETVTTVRAEDLVSAEARRGAGLETV